MKVQSISRKNLQVLYKIACTDWQTRINKVLSDQQFSDEIEVKDSDVIEAHNSADASQKKLIEKYFTLPQKIQDRIKTLKDVYDELGLLREDVIPYKNPKNKWEKSVNAGLDIQHISQVLNQGWLEDFDNRSQYKYFPIGEKKPSGWVVHCYYDFSSFALLGLGFYFSSSELALYAGNQFLKEVYQYYWPS